MRIVEMLANAALAVGKRTAPVTRRVRNAARRVLFS